MPDPNEYANEKEWMAACVPARIAEGDEQDQAVAVCLAMWAKKSVDVTAPPEFADPDDSLKIGARNSAADQARLQMIHDYAVENGAVCKPMDASGPLAVLSVDDAVVTYGGEIKSLPDGRIGGYLVLFGTPDQPDISPQRDYFDAKTDFGLKPGERRQTPVWFNHRLPLKTSNGREVVIRDKIGDGEVWLDDQGVFIEAVLYNRKRYEAALGALGWSSGTAAHLVERTPVKGANHVDLWPLGLDASITPTPAEPRTQVIPLKSLSDNAYLPPIPLTLDPEADAERAETGDGDGGQPIKSNHLEVTMDITKEDLQAMLDRAAENAIKALPAEPVKAGVTVVTDEADQPFESAGAFFRAVKHAAYYPMSEDPRLRPLKATGMSEGVPADGGYLVQPQVAGGIIQRMLETGQILSRVASDTVTGNSMVYNGVDETTHSGSVFGGVIPYWLNEGGTKTASRPKFYQVELKLKKLAALCYATDELLDDASALQSWLMRNVPDALRWYVESAIISGDGVGKPLGITQSPCLVSQVREDANEINPSDFANMWSRRWQGANDYVWLINPTVAAWMNVFAVGNWPVYMPQGNMTGKPFATLYGAPVIESEHIAAAKSAGDVILASLSNYQTISKGGIQSASSIHVAFTTDETAFRFVYRIDGAPLWHSALTPANGPTVSPFVSLAAASS